MGDPFNSTKAGRPFAQDLQRWLRQWLSISADVNHSILKERSDRNNRITGELFNANQPRNAQSSATTGFKNGLDGAEKDDQIQPGIEVT